MQHFAASDASSPAALRQLLSALEHLGAHGSQLVFHEYVAEVQAKIMSMYKDMIANMKTDKRLQMDKDGKLPESYHKVFQCVGLLWRETPETFDWVKKDLHEDALSVILQVTSLLKGAVQHKVVFSASVQVTLIALQAYVEAGLNAPRKYVSRVQTEIMVVYDAMEANMRGSGFRHIDYDTPKTEYHDLPKAYEEVETCLNLLWQQERETKAPRAWVWVRKRLGHGIHEVAPSDIKQLIQLLREAVTLMRKNLKRDPFDAAVQKKLTDLLTYAEAGCLQ